MAYNHRVSTHHRSKRAQKIKKVTLAFMLFLMVGSVIVGVDWYLSQKDSTKSVTTKEIKSTVRSANITVYRTDYFQFQAPDGWVLVSGSPDSNKFVYLSNNGSIVSRRFIVYINKPLLDIESDQDVTRVLPVEYNTNGTFSKIGSISDSCDIGWPEDLPRNPSRIKLNSVSFVCTPGSKQFNVMIGEVGGDEVIESIRSDGTKFNMTLLYSDLSAYPSAGDIKNILSSFRTL